MNARAKKMNKKRRDFLMHEKRGVKVVTHVFILITGVQE